MERKIFNFKTEILKQDTIEMFGYDPDLISEKSTKYIIFSCRYCGKAVKSTKRRINKVGSACHNECRIEEMKKQVSPFSDPLVREKARLKMKEKLGVEFASQNKEVAQKI